MRKTLYLVFISITGLAAVACNFLGAAQFALETQSVDSPSEEGQTSQFQADPLPTISPLDSAKSCLAKTWEIPGLSDYVIAAIPPDLAAEYNLKYQETKGEAYFTLTPDGHFTLVANHLELIFSAKAFIFEVPVTVRVDGRATGDYDVDLTTLTISNVDTSGLSASAQAMGEDLVDPAQIINAVPFIRPPFNTAKYTCQGDTLELEFTGYSGKTPPLIFEAVK